MRRGRRRSRAAAAPNRWKGRQPAVRGAGLLVGWPAGGPSTLLTRRGQLDDALYSCAVPVLRALRGACSSAARSSTTPCTADEEACGERVVRGGSTTP